MNGMGAMAGGFGMKGLKDLVGLNGGQAQKAQKAQKPQTKPSAAELGRDGALTRGKGFSQRDSFEPARQAQQAQKNGQPKPGDSQASARQNVQQSQLQQNQQADADKRAQQGTESRQVQQFQDALLRLATAIKEATEYDEEDLRKKLLEFKQWLKEMDAIFAATPAT